MKIQRFLGAIIVAALLMSCGGSTNSDANVSNGDGTGSDGGSAQAAQVVDGSQSSSASLDAKDIQDIVEQFKACKSAAEKPHMCKEYVAKAVAAYYGYGGLKNEKGEDLDYDQLYEFVSASDDWVSLGSAKDQEVLNKAQENANNGKATLALNTKGSKSVAILVKGKLSHSNSMGLDCPSVAVLRPRSVNKSFVGKGINYAWSDLGDVEIFSLK